jgi:hypothetical protein
MVRMLITGSSDGLGSMAAELLAEVDHIVTVHARSERHAAAAQQSLRSADHVARAAREPLGRRHHAGSSARAFGGVVAVATGDHPSHLGDRSPPGSHGHDHEQQVPGVDVTRQVSPPFGRLRTPLPSGGTPRCNRPRREPGAGRTTPAPPSAAAGPTPGGHSGNRSRVPAYSPISSWSPPTIGTGGRDASQFV